MHNRGIDCESYARIESNRSEAINVRNHVHMSLLVKLEVTNDCKRAKQVAGRHEGGHRTYIGTLGDEGPQRALPIMMNETYRG
jgi:hypothetical protein